MQSMKFKGLVLLLSILFCSHVFAAAGAESGGEGGGAGPAEDIDYQKLLTSINSLESSINSKRAEIKELIKANNSKNPRKKVRDEEGRDITTESLYTAYRDLKGLEKSWMEKKREIKYKYPAQGRIIERRYYPVGSKTLEELESELGLEGDLTRVKNKITKKYKKFLPTEEIEKAAIKEKKKFDEKEKAKRISLER